MLLHKVKPICKFAHAQTSTQVNKLTNYESNVHNHHLIIITNLLYVLYILYYIAMREMIPNIRTNIKMVIAQAQAFAGVFF